MGYRFSLRWTSGALLLHGLILIINMMDGQCKVSDMHDGRRLSGFRKCCACASAAECCVWLMSLEMSCAQAV